MALHPAHQEPTDYAPPSSTVVALPLRQYWPRRFILVGLCFLSTFVCYIDRVNMSVAIIPMAEEFKWDQTTRGIVLSSFFYGYLTTQVLGGWLADRYGGKVVLGFGVLWWSIFTLLTPPAAAISLAVLFMARVGMGLGEGVAFPAIHNLFARWVPVRERARSVALNTSGIPLGTVGALLLTPAIVLTWGWQAVFYCFGVLGFLWFGLWYFLAADSPDMHPTIHPTEVQIIRENSPLAPKNEKIPWSLLLSKVPVWAIIINHFCSNWGFYVILTWLPTYFKQALGADLSKVGIYTILPWLVMFLMGNVAGWIADNLLKAGFSLTFVRKLMQSIGFLGAATFLSLISGVTTITQAILYMCCTLGLGAFALSGFAVNHLDIGPRYAGILLGFSNTAGTIPGIVGVTLTGLILDATGSWNLVFLISAGVYVFGALVWLLFATGERIFE
ncbi:MAG: ACS family MFS transporter [Deltaproteobacteria bacterium]|nr:ACS family MFS transporter [Deltaproteobacteria bacterium]